MRGEGIAWRGNGRRAEERGRKKESWGKEEGKIARGEEREGWQQKMRRDGCLGKEKGWSVWNRGRSDG